MLLLFQQTTHIKLDKAQFALSKLKLCSSGPAMGWMLPERSSMRNIQTAILLLWLEAAEVNEDEHTVTVLCCTGIFRPSHLPNPVICILHPFKFILCFYAAYPALARVMAHFHGRVRDSSVCKGAARVTFPPPKVGVTRTEPY